MVLISFARRRRDLPFPWMFWMFGAFIIGCGTTHLMEVVTTYVPVYRLAGLIKLLTALVSLVTAVVLVPLVPKALLLRGPRDLQQEIEERKRVEAELRRAHDELERRVQERTAELARANASLHAEVAVRRQAEAELRESEGRLRLFIDNAPAAIAMFDRDMRYLAVSRRWLADYRLDEDVTGRSHYQVFSEIPEHWREIHRRGLAGEVLRAEDDPFERADNTMQWIRWEIRPWHKSSGEVGGIVIFAEDVTERKRAGQALRESEQRLRMAQQVTQIGTFDWNIQTGVNTWTPELEAMYGLPVGGFPRTQEAWEALVHPEDRAHAAQRVSQALNQGGFADEWRIIWPDGSVRWLAGRASVLKDDSGEPLRLLGVNIDITERKRAEKTREESEARFRQLADLMSQLAWMAQPDGSIYWYNKRWYEYTGTTLEQMSGWGWQSIHDPRELPKVMERWQVSIATGQPFDMVFPLRGADGRFRPFLTRIVPLRGDDGRILHWFGTNTDISDQKQAEEEVRRLNAELEQRVRDRTAELETANKELEAFSYSVSHDLRAPLRAIDGFSRILLQQNADELSAEARERLQLVRDGTRQMGQLVDDLLAFARLSRQPMRPQLVDSARLVRQCLAELQGEREGRQVEIVVRDLPSCQAEPSLLKQVWVNLIANALKYTRRREAARIEIGCLRGEGEPRSVYFVKDNGVGFDMRYADKLFGVFQRLHRAEDYEGTGVGLAIVQRIVHRHGGRIWAEAEKDNGAAFYFTIGQDPS